MLIIDGIGVGWICGWPFIQNQPSRGLTVDPVGSLETLPKRAFTRCV